MSWIIIEHLGAPRECARQGIARFILDIYEENTPALNLYSLYGFTDLGCHTGDYGSDDLTQFHLCEYALWPLHIGLSHSLSHCFNLTPEPEMDVGWPQYRRTRLLKVNHQPFKGDKND